jgi:hypothetical protein
MAPDPTSDIFRGVCAPFLWCLFPIGLMRLNTVRCFCPFTYTQTNLTRDEILQNHLSFFNTFNIPKNQDQFDLPWLYWIPKLHKKPYKQRCVAGFSKCSTEPLSLFPTKLLTAIKESLLLYFPEVVSIRSGFARSLKKTLRKFKVPWFFYKIDIKTILNSLLLIVFLNESGIRKYKVLELGETRYIFCEKPFW